MDRDDILKRILNEEDFVHAPKFGNSLIRLKASILKANNVESAEDSVIAKALMMTEEEVQKIYDEAVVMLKEGMDDE